MGAGNRSRDGTWAGQGLDTNERGWCGGDGKDGWVLVVFSTFIFLVPPTVAAVALLSSTSLLRTENSKTARCRNIQTATLYL